MTTATASILAEHHDRLETRCLALLGETFADDPRALNASWRGIETQLLDHIALEDSALLPGYARVNSEAASAIRAQHEHLLELLNRVGLEIQLHVLRPSSMRALVRALRTHAVYEGLTLYRWADATLDPPEREALCARLAH